MRGVKYAVFTALLSVATILTFTQTALAADPLVDACSSNPNSTTCLSRGTGADPLTGTHGLLYNISLIIATITGIIAVIVIIVSGLRLITSGGDAQKAAGARKSLFGAIIGLVIIVLAQTIITFVVRKL